MRHRKGKSGPTDAEMAARSVLAGVADATPKSGEGEVEMIRMLKSTKNSAVKARTQAVNQMKALVLTAPTELRETLDGLGANALAVRYGSFRPGHLVTPTEAVKYAIRSLARRVSSATRCKIRGTSFSGSSRRRHRCLLKPLAWDLTRQRTC